LHINSVHIKWRREHKLGLAGTCVPENGTIFWPGRGGPMHNFRRHAFSKSALFVSLLTTIAVAATFLTRTPPIFLPPANYSTDGPNAIAVADVNGDGKPD